jgi:hypothetical protein
LFVVDVDFVDVKKKKKILFENFVDIVYIIVV